MIAAGVVQHTIGWLMQRRLVRDYGTRPDNSASMITVTMFEISRTAFTDGTTPTRRDSQIT
ncbi:hypothetical protein GCM10009828_058010 [Actinoplanes couchii]|uniref:Uncharacterized protein n=1 Tax=Actinoplanes couchii TaxID=403638 RepID=A0ABQ3XUA2_9ACTN|nr:hypothetical protein Aco03nite_104860 [Actinoplanes couchii]